MTFEQWAQKYKPITCADDTIFVFCGDAPRAPRDLIRTWTILSNPNGWTLVNGLQTGNIVGYATTEEPFLLDEVIRVRYRSRILDRGNPLLEALP